MMDHCQTAASACKRVREMIQVDYMLAAHKTAYFLINLCYGVTRQAASDRKQNVQLRDLLQVSAWLDHS